MKKIDTPLNDYLLTVEMPDGSTWGVPVMVIAENRAEHYADEFNNDVERSLNEDTIPLFEADNYEVEDWARSNMDWSDVKEHARVLIRKRMTDEDYQEGWVNGDTDVEEVNVFLGNED